MLVLGKLKGIKIYSTSVCVIFNEIDEDRFLVWPAKIIRVVVSAALETKGEKRRH